MQLTECSWGERRRSYRIKSSVAARARGEEGGGGSSARQVPGQQLLGHGGGGDTQIPGQWRQPRDLPNRAVAIFQKAEGADIIDVCDSIN